MTYPQVTVLGIGPEGHEQQVHILIGQQPAQLWKLDVITDQNAHTPGIGIEHLQLVTALDNPVATFLRGDMQLGLALLGTVPAQQIGDVVQTPVLAFLDHRTSDDVDVITDRHAQHLGAEALGKAAEETDRFDIIGLIAQAHQRRIEQLREYRKVATVIR